MWLAQEGIDVQTDDLGRRAIARSVFGALVREHTSQQKLMAERAALRVAEQAEVERREPVPAGVPALEGLSARETMMASPDYVSVRDELGNPRVDWLADELEKGAAARAEEEAQAKERAAARMLNDLGKGKQ
jgi:hypothetical protein